MEVQITLQLLGTSALEGIVKLEKIIILLLFTHPHVVPKL